MTRLRRLLRGRALKVLALCGLALWAGNSTLLRPLAPTEAGPRLLAHRGVHQLYAGTSPRDDTCTAQPVAPITHGFIENTRPSMAAAFALGADVVELDVHLTPDGAFAVFHDWTLECRTNGTGQTNKTDMDVLRGLDAGYGYTADGVSFPLRGTGVGLIETLPDILAAFPEGRFLINFKSNRGSEGKALAALLRDQPGWIDQIFGVYGGPKPTARLTREMPQIRGFDYGRIRACLLRYAALGWSGHVPGPCRDTMLLLPSNVAPWLWGWPGVLERRLTRAGTDLILVGPYQGSLRIDGIDSPAALARVPAGFGGYVWTNDLPRLTGRQP